MSRTLVWIAIAIISLCGTVAADPTRPHHVTVLDFDGPRALADAGRAHVLGALADDCVVIGSRTWDYALARSTEHGARRWHRASVALGVDTVIEGWIVEEGRHHVLSVSVREARSGLEIDTINVRIGNDGTLSDDARKRLAGDLAELMAWIDIPVVRMAAPAFDPGALFDHMFQPSLVLATYSP